MTLTFWKYISVFILSLWACSLYGQTNSNIVNQWLELANKYRYDNPDSAIYYCQKIIEKESNTPKSPEKAEAYRILSIPYEGKGEYEQALKYANQALELWREIDNEGKIAHTLNSIGIIYDQQGRFEEALKQYNEAYDIYKKLGDEKNIAMMDVNLGILFKAQGQYKQVIEHYQSAYQTYKKLKLPEEIAFCEANLGSIYYYTQQYDSCIYYSQKAERALTNQNNLRFLPVAQANAGLGFLALEKIPEAKEYLNKALTTHRKFGNKKEMSFVLIHLARLFQKEGKSDYAFQALNEAKALAQSINSPQQHMDASKLLAEYFAAKEDFKNAYTEYIEYTTVKDSLFAQQKNKEISNHQVRYETQRKEQEIALLTQENQIHELALKQRNLYLIIALLLILITSFIAWFINRTKKFREIQLKKEADLQAELVRLEAQNQLQNDRLRISRDLHDNIGANLTYIHTSINEIENDNKHLRDVKSLVNDTIKELRRTVWMINKPAITVDEWIIKLREYYSRVDKIQILTSLSEETENHILSSKEGTALFRIIQEATNNSLKYSQASEIKVYIYDDNKNIKIKISDNGTGFDRTQATNGFGLQNMQQHAQEIGATYNINSEINKGTTIEIQLHIP